MHHPIIQYLLLAAASFMAGAINSVAGGGTLLTFPALLSVGVSPVLANGTSTMALVPGSVSAFWGYRKEESSHQRDFIAMAAPSLLGGVAGALLVIKAGDSIFARLIPWLVIGATVLFILQDPIRRWLDRKREAGSNGVDAQERITPGGVIFQFLVAVYGGFFGAGIGILMLAALGMMGLKNIHKMNRLKNFAAVCINGVGAVTFAVKGKVDWPIAGLMAVGAILGGYLGAGLARRAGQQNVKRTVVAIGLLIGVYMLIKPIK